MQIILPDNPIFWETIHSALPPGWQNAKTNFSGTFAVRHDSWLLEPLSPEEEEEYLLGGEDDTFDDLEYWQDDCTD